MWGFLNTPFLSLSQGLSLPSLCLFCISIPLPSSHCCSFCSSVSIPLHYLCLYVSLSSRQTFSPQTSKTPHLTMPPLPPFPQTPHP